MHTVRHRCTEKHSLSLVGHSPEDFLYLRSEAHIEHAISLVEHEIINIAQIDTL